MRKLSKCYLLDFLRGVNFSIIYFVTFREKFKASCYLYCEDFDNLICVWGEQGLNHGQIMDVPALEKLIDSISLSEVQGVASKMMKSKGSLVYFGNLDNAVCLEDLI